MTTDNLRGTGARIRFYGSLEVSLLAWVAMALSVGGFLGAGGLPIYVVTLTGILVILGAAMRHPSYRALRRAS